MPDSNLILVFEPNTNDALMLEEALQLQDCRSQDTRVLRHGSELRSYLAGAGIYQDRQRFPLPDLLLLDFFQAVTAVNILEWLGRCRYLAWLPVIGLGKNIGPGILQLAFDLGMSGYFDKSVNTNSLAQMISCLRRVDGWQFKWSDSDEVHLLTKEQFYRSGAA